MLNELRRRIHEHNDKFKQRVRKHKGKPKKKKKKRMLKLYQTSLDHNAMRLEINYEGKNCQNTNIWRLKNMLLNNKWVTEENKEEIKNYLETQWSKIYGT